MRRRHCKGFIGIPMVTVMAIIFTLSVTMVFTTGLMRRDQVAKTQLRLDYNQREETILRAVLAIVPRKAMAIMKEDYAASSSHSWASIFTEAIAVASAADSIPEDMRMEFAIARVRSGDVGDHTSEEIASWITSLSGVAGEVTPGLGEYADIFAAAFGEGYQEKLPPFLDFDPASPFSALDGTHPIVRSDKRYLVAAPGLLADVNTYYPFNLIPYPSVRFSYIAPGQPFVGKRNWWAFKIHYGSGEEGVVGATSGVSKNYILSLYEIPAQLPIEAPTLTEVGRHQDGTAWNGNIQIDGGIYAASLLMNGTYGADRVSGRRAIEIAESITLDGRAISGNFDALGERERLQAVAMSRVLPIGLSANSGRVVFFPLPSDYSFLTRRVGPITAWDNYLGGAQRCQMHVEVLKMVSLEDQTPTLIRVSFDGADGLRKAVELDRQVEGSWPSQIEDPLFPFQTELTASMRSCLTFYPSLLNDWLVSRQGKPVSENGSVFISVDSSRESVRVLSYPPNVADMCVIIRKGRDLRSFSNGLSIVTPHRVYIGDDLNEVPFAAPPVGSGLEAGTDYYPPMSIFTSELRVGTIAFNRPIDHHGQLGTLLSGESTWNPLDVRSGTDDAILTDTMEANLRGLKSPAELPPVHQMNWMLTIEEIP